MSPKSRALLRYSISFLIAFAFLYYAFQGVRLADLWRSLKGADYWWVLMLVPLNILSNWVRAVRWAYLLAPIKSNMSRRNLFSGVMIGYAVNNILPRVGELVRPYVIGKLEGISKSSALATVVVERILDFMSFYFIVCIVLFVYPHSLDPFIQDAKLARPLLLLGSFALLAIFVLLYFKAESFFRIVAKAVHFAPRKMAARIEPILDSFYTGFAVSKMRSQFGIILLQSFLIWGFYALGMYIPFFAFADLVRPDLDFGSAVVLLVISSISWILPAPGAMGTYHSFLTVAMIRLYGVSATTALSYAIVTHEVGYLVVMVIGGYYYFRDHFRVSELSHVSQKGE
jgi:uncharacterized protein (TIRG00374 family)